LGNQAQLRTFGAGPKQQDEGQQNQNDSFGKIATFDQKDGAGRRLEAKVHAPTMVVKQGQMLTGIWQPMTKF